MDTKKIMTIHISESGTVKDKIQKTAIINAIAIPYNDRNDFKDRLKETLIKSGVEPDKRIIKWTKVAPKEQHVYMNVLTIVNKDNNIKDYAIKIRKFEYYKLANAYVQLLENIQKDFPDFSLRVFLQFQKNKFFRKKVNDIKSLLTYKNLNIEILESPIEESRFIQIADLIGGAILFFSRDDMYLEKMGSPGKAIVVEHGLALKKKQDKLTIINYKEDQNE